MAYKRLGEILASAGIVSEEQINKALEDSKAKGQRLGEYLINEDIISEDQLINTLKMQLGVDFIDLTKVSFAASLTQLVPKNIARKYTVVPVKSAGDNLYLAMVDPLNYNAIEEVRASSRKKVVPMIATRSAAEQAIANIYGNESVNKAIDDLQQAINSDPAAAAASEEQVNKVNKVEDDEASAPTIRLVNSIIERGALSNASDIHIEPREDALYVRMRIDGVLHQILTVPKNLQSSVISRIKVMADMDISERRIPQDGRTNVSVQGKDYDLRISTLPVKYGEKVVIRFLVKSAELLSTNGIGLEGKQLEAYRELMKNSNGVILITGPTGSGKSTTMYTMIGELNKEEVNLVTLEDPIEYDMPGINQVQINEKVGMTFAGGLRSILRQDPDVIAVGEIRDGETAEIAMRAAITGHLVLSTIHTNSSLATLDRLEDIGVEPYLTASALKGVIAQRLVRRLCPRCRQAYRASAEDLAEMGISQSEERTFYKAAGCPECFETGYKGRIAVFEILVLNHEIKQKYREKAPHSELEKAVEASGFETMLVNCRRLVESGVTTVSEAAKILHSTDQ